MRNYELTLIFSPQVSEKEVNDIFQQLLSSVQEKGGILHDQKLMGKSPLLSPIQAHKEGYVAFVSFALNPEHLSELEKSLREMQSILRFLVISQPRKAAMPRKEIPPAPREDQAPRNNKLYTGQAMASVNTAAPAAPQTEEEKIDLKDIDEKLEEIFKEL